MMRNNESRSLEWPHACLHYLTINLQYVCHRVMVVVLFVLVSAYYHEICFLPHLYVEKKGVRVFYGVFVAENASFKSSGITCCLAPCELSTEKRDSNSSFHHEGYVWLAIDPTRHWLIIDPSTLADKLLGFLWML